MAECHPRRRNKGKGLCAECYSKAYEAKRPGRWAAARTARTAAQPDARRDAYYRREYGITLAEYERLLVEQGGRCAICRRRPGRRRLSVDHDHTTGRVRGLLCSDRPGCNSALARFDKDPKTARRAAAYLLVIANDLAGNKESGADRR